MDELLAELDKKDKAWEDKIKKKMKQVEGWTKMKEFNYAVYRYAMNVLEDLLREE